MYQMHNQACPHWLHSHGWFLLEPEKRPPIIVALFQIIIYLPYFWLCWALIVVHRLLISVTSLVAEHMLSMRGLQQLGTTDLVALHRVESSQTGDQTHALSPALVGRFSSAVPPGKSCNGGSDTNQMSNNSIQSSLDTTYSWLGADPTGLRSHFHKTTPTSDINCKSWGVHPQF